MSGGGGATEFVRFNSNSKKFEVDPGAVRNLQQLKGPVAVVVVCGRARQGKSFLLNQLLSRLRGGASSAPGHGFAVASSYRPCTKGLWLWSQPVPRKAADGTPYHLVLVDAEGIDAFDQTLDYSTQIFSLGVLLSSMLVFNQMGSIDESSIDKLSNVCEFAKLIRGKAGGARDLQELSPAFLWLLRDFQFDLTERDGRQLTMKDYMEETLADMAGNTDGVRNRNQMRSSIKALFPDRDCFALVRPMAEEQQLNKMDTLPYTALRPEFKSGLERLVDLLATRALPKQFHGSYMTGSALAAFASAYVDVINKGGVPVISSTWQSVVAGECQRALEAALEVYRREFSADVAPEEAELDAEHQRALEVALASFSDQALGAPGERAAYEARLRARAGELFKESRTARLAQAEGRVSQLLGQATGKFSELYLREPLDLAAADEQLASFLADYDTQAHGPSKYHRVAEFLVNTCVRGIAGVARRAQAAGQAAAAREQATAKELAVAKKQLEDVTQQLAASQSQSRQQLVDLQQQLSHLQQQLSHLQQQYDAARAELTNKSKALSAAESGRDGHHRELLEAKSRAELLAQKLALSESSESAGRQQLGELQARLSRQAADLDSRAAQVTKLQQDLHAAQGTAAAAQRDVSGRMQQADSELNRHRAELKNATDRLAAALAREQQYRGEVQEQLRVKDESVASIQRDLAEARQAAAGSSATAAQLAQVRQQLSDKDRQLLERDQTLQNLQRRNEFLEKQYATLHRASLSPSGVPPTAAAGGTSHADADMADADAPGPRKRARTEPSAPPLPTATTQRPHEAANAQPIRFSGDIGAAPPSGGTAAGARGAAGTGAFATPPVGSGGAPSTSPFTHEVLLGTAAGRSTAGPTPTPGTPGAAATPVRRPLPDNADKMSINELKSYLTDNGFEKDVFEYLSRKPAPKKADWLQLLKDKSL